MSQDALGQVYAELEIRIGPQLGSGYPFVVRSADGKKMDAGYFELPFEWEKLEPVLAARRVAAQSGQDEALLLELGQQLFHALFGQKAGEVYCRYLDKAAGRLRLLLTIAQPELVRLPWEYLHNGKSFLGLDLQTPVVRGVVTTPWAVRSERPLRLLIVGASPLDQAALAVTEERRQIEEELRQATKRGDIIIRRLDGEQMDRDLPQALLEFAPHVLHFAGHGQTDGLLLEGAGGRGLPVSGTGLRDLIANVKSLRLVVLNACDLAGIKDKKRLSVAARLVQVGLPMAVGMQFAISDRAALAFSEGFYEALAQRLPLEAATAWARARISYYLGRGRDTVEWGTPVVYMAAAPWKVDWEQVGARSLSRRLRQKDQLPAKIAGRDGKEMCLVPAGDFLMGSKSGSEDERPSHRVEQSLAFWMDTYPVTNAEYARFVAETGCKTPAHWPEGNCPTELADYPVVHVSWEDAAAYARWAGKRLPTEAEWEKAARGSDGRAWPWGDTFEPSRANTWESQRGGSSPVGAYSPQGDSPYRLADMAGNVWEWTADWYQAYPGSSYASDRFGEQYKVLRGGSWGYPGGFARCAARSFDLPGFSCDSYGFRCVLDREMYTRRTSGK
jgi:formylglycine-generating enzyme required for sulfatase activity